MSARTEADPDARCGVIAATQFGLITLQQAIESGLSPDAVRRRVRLGRWVRVQPKVYLIAGAPKSWHQRALAVVLSAEGAALFGLTAAAAHQLDGCALTRDIHFVTERNCGPRRGAIHHRSAFLLAGEVVSVGGLPVTSLSRTLIDLAGLVGNQTLETAFASVLRKRLLSTARFQLDLLRFPRNHPGKGALSKLVSQYATDRPPESGLEVEVLRILREAGYPTPVCQQVINDDGKFIGRVDLAWPSRRLVVEVDSFRWHTESKAWHKDLDRRNELIARGLTVMHATKRSVKRPASFLRSFEKVWRSLEPS